VIEQNDDKTTEMYHLW